MQFVAISLALMRLPRLLADLVAGAFAPEDDVHVDLLADASEVDVGETGGRPRYDVVITGVEDPAAAEVDGLLTQRRDLVVFGVRPDGREAWIYELRPCPRSLGQVGPALLRRAVLDALHART